MKAIYFINGLIAITPLFLAWSAIAALQYGWAQGRRMRIMAGKTKSGRCCRNWAPRSYEMRGA